MADIVVSVKEGKIRGRQNKSSFTGKEFYSFFGVPYGEPAINRLRFKDPVKVKPWKSIRDATTENRSGCSQFSLHAGQFMGSEDCLYNTIHTSKLPSEKEALKPVIVGIHPGGFRYGNPEHFGIPDLAMSHDIVYVCIAYRLHMLGFLNLNLKECSGNQGLKDILLGLQWLKENISSFNGDPENITLLGSSSGGTIIHLLMLSPAAKGLFNKAILLSYAFPPHATYAENETAAFRIAYKLGFQGTDRKKLLAFLKTLPVEALIPVQKQYENEYETEIAPVFPQSVFLPTVDAASRNPVLPVSPRKLIDSIAPMPTIFGICERESVIGFTTKKVRRCTEQNYKTGYRQNTWSWMHDLNNDEMKIINNEVEAYYLKGCPKGNASLSATVDMLTEVSFHDVYDTLINPLAAKPESSVYLYKFLFESDLPTMKDIFSGMMREELSGTYHASDYSYWCSRPANKLSQKAIRMIEIYTTMITSFARNGNPNYEQLGIEWRPTSVENPCYLSIDDTLQMVDGELLEGMAFWKDIKERFKKK